MIYIPIIALANTSESEGFLLRLTPLLACLLISFFELPLSFH